MRRLAALALALGTACTPPGPAPDVATTPSLPLAAPSLPRATSLPAVTVAPLPSVTVPVVEVPIPTELPMPTIPARVVEVLSTLPAQPSFTRVPGIAVPTAVPVPMRPLLPLPTGVPIPPPLGR
jgi:hypothetical protein